jgi:putative transposase
MRFVHSGHGIYFAEYHVCWCAKYRRCILNPGVAEYVRKILPKIVRSMAGVHLCEVGIDETMRDHIHLVIQIPPRYSRSDVIAQIKAESASQLRKKFAWLKQVYWKENIVWSPGFFLSTVGVDKKVIESYVKWQGKKDLDQLQMKL